MAIEFICPSCQGTLRVADSSAGGVVRCGNCLGTLRVPLLPDAATSPSEPEPEPRRAAEPIAPPPPPRREAEEDYGEPRPRPRRRRPPPRPAGRGALFWVMMALLFVGLLTAATCGGIFLVLQPKWRVHHSGAGGYKVELPAEARNDMEEMVRARGAIQPNVRIEGTLLLVKLEEYSVVYADIDEQLRPFMQDEDILDDAVTGLEEDEPGVVILRDNPTTVSGFPAREVVFTHSDGGTYVCRIVVADTRLYIVTAGGPNMDTDGNERTRRFLDSFEVTDARLMAKQKQQAMLKDFVRPGAEPDHKRPRDRNRVKD